MPKHPGRALQQEREQLLDELQHAGSDKPVILRMIKVLNLQLE
jgi:hypothetical protein